MPLSVELAKDLPEQKDYGFYVLDNEGERIIFAHWYSDGSPSYSDVFNVVGKRLTEMGFEDEVQAVEGHIVGLFGLPT